MKIDELEKRFAQIDSVYGQDDYSLVQFDGNKLTVYTEPVNASMGPDGQQQLPPRFELELGPEDVSDDVVDERFRIALDNDLRGTIPGVKLMQLGASAIYEVIEDYSVVFSDQDVGMRISQPSYPLGRMLTYEETLQMHRAGDMSYRDNHPWYPPVDIKVTAKKGFQYDRASIPRIFWVLISKDDLSNVPPLFHDLLYRFGGILPDAGDHVNPYTRFDRDNADKLFDILMEQCGVSGWRRKAAYMAVSMFSGFAWKRSPEDEDGA